MRLLRWIRIVLAILLLSANQLYAQHFFSVYCNDNNTIKIKLASVDSIVHSKIDINGIEHISYQTTEIWTPDSIYRIAMEDIDSVSVISVEEVAHYIANVTTGMAPLMKNSYTIDDLIVHIDEIKAIDGVEDVWYDDITLYVDVRGWGAISYMFPPIPEDDETLLLAREKAISKAIHNQADLSKVGIVNLFRGDSSFSRANNNAYQISQNFINCGFTNTDYLSRAGLGFFENDMFDYDILFLMTHGGYNNGLHYIVTSDLIDISPEGDPFGNAVAFLKFDERFKNVDTNKINFGCVKISGDEVSNFYYVMISEQYIKSLSKRFNKKTIVFMTACKALKGKQYLADAFIGKGAGTVLGYTDTNNMGDAAAYYFFNNMLNGMSSMSAEEAIPENLRHKSYTHDGKTYNPRLLIMGSNLNTCIVHPQTDDYEDLSTDTKLEVKLRGKMTKLNPNEMDDLELGFCLTTTEGYYEDTDKMKAEIKPQNHSVDFELVLNGDNLKPETQYYYRVYLYDGINYCYGEDRSFKTKAVEMRLCPNDNHPHAIDLGLPSGTKWACCNVGADKPRDRGDYYAWGEIETKRDYQKNTYIHQETVAPYGYKDIGKDIAGTDFDAASNAKDWGGWQMPTKEQFEELIEYTQFESFSRNLLEGYYAKGSNGNAIFIPCNGRFYGFLPPSWPNSECYYWSSTLYTSSVLPDYNHDAYYLTSYGAGVQTKIYLDSNDRMYGQGIRAVKMK